MQPIEIVVIVIAALVVLLSLLGAIYRKKKGKSSCGCKTTTKKCSDCANCPYASHCKEEDN